ncbi:MAG: hypothetical protein DME61_01460 [Verrucomicrobia bacterium]|nr:MAG: hypothetical protein DME61_01460 [Verrucomicrobiota bacterium]PYL68723.1 MAG: hypothetical protein DMF28_05895 [Verrucomicrobiota bacterium]
MRDAGFEPATSCVRNMIGDFAFIREIALSCCHYSYCNHSDFFALRNITHTGEGILSRIVEIGRLPGLQDIGKPRKLSRR